jgi:8-oxo-dGTP diphosphatase
MTPGVGCGAAILRGRRLLLVKRLKAPEAGHWNLPGGKVEFGERAAVAVAREVAEELGVAIEVTGSLGFVEMIGDDQHWVSPIYRAEIRNGEPFNAEPAKHEAILWADLDAPPAPLALAARTAIAQLRPTALAAPSPLAGEGWGGG